MCSLPTMRRVESFLRSWCRVGNECIPWRAPPRRPAPFWQVGPAAISRQQSSLALEALSKRPERFLLFELVGIGAHFELYPDLPYHTATPRTHGGPRLRDRPAPHLIGRVRLRGEAEAGLPKTSSK